MKSTVTFLKMIATRLSQNEDNNDTSAQSHEEVENKGASHNINHSAHANHQEESRDKQQ